MKYNHKLEIGCSTLSGDGVLSMDFYVYGPFDTEHLISGRLDWQDDLTIWQSECIDIEELVPLSQYIQEVVIPECIEWIGKNWELGGRDS